MEIGVNREAPYMARASAPLNGYYGTIFEIKYRRQPISFTLYSFASTDGSNPSAGLVLSGETLYGTTVKGGALYDGTVIRSQYQRGQASPPLHSFAGNPSDGAKSVCGSGLWAATQFLRHDYAGGAMVRNGISK